jgi:hypothetical protein
MFSAGQIITPDFFLLFPVNSAPHTVQVYFSQWNPGGLGYSSSQPAGYLLISGLVVGGVPAPWTEPLVLVSLAIAGAISFQIFIEPYLKEPRFALLGAVLFLLSPCIFIDVFNASSWIPIDFLLPTVFLLSLRMSQGPIGKPLIQLSLVLGLIFAFVPLGPVLILPLLLLLPFSIALTRRSIRIALRTLFAISGAVVLGLLLNAPFYFGNLSHFSSGALQPSFAAAVSVIPISYGFSTPLQFFSLLGAGLYIRYAGFYSLFSEALLIGFVAFALSGLLFLKHRRYQELGVLAAVLYATCTAWIFLTKDGFTLPLYHAFGLLTALNYPGALYAYIVISLSVLATFTIDWIAHTEGESATTGNDLVKPKLVVTDLQTGFPKLHRLRRDVYPIAHHPLTVASCILVLTLLIVPSTFYLESGNFEEPSVSTNVGFPPQWSATIPSAYPAMYDFLQSHGSTSSSRFLILPFPGFQGGLQFNPFAINTFGLPEYQGSTTATNLFQGPRNSIYSTSVLNYFIDNRTDQIGVLFGEASVKYVLVDLQADFTGPPRWIWDSLVGSPAIFLGLLRAQADLEEVYDSSLFVAFVNLDYVPYVTGASGVVVVHSGTGSSPLNHTIGGWTANISGWYGPGPSNRISRIDDFPARYDVYGVNGTGEMNISFSNATDSITGSSLRLNNAGFYVVSTRIPVFNQQYAVSFNQAYSGPVIHGAGYVLVVGDTSNGSYIWGIPSYTVANSSQRNVSVAFNPDEESSQTASVDVVVAFPAEFGSGRLISYAVSNLSISIDLPTVPSPILAALPLSQLPPQSSIVNSALLPSFDFSSSTAVDLADADVKVGQVCIDLCPTNLPLTGQLLFAYLGTNVVGSFSTVEIAPNALASEVVSTHGSLNTTLQVNPSPFDSIWLRAAGNGWVTIFEGPTALTRIAVSNDSLQWYQSSVNRSVETDQLTINVFGSVQLDSIWLEATDEDGVTKATDGGLTATVTYSSLTEYQGTLGTATTIVVLSQGFDPSWVMTVGNFSASSIMIGGWENGFPIPALVGGNGQFSIVFTGQTYHVAFIIVEAGFFFALLTLWIVASIPYLSARGSRLVYWLRSRWPSRRKSV